MFLLLLGVGGGSQPNSLLVETLVAMQFKNQAVTFA